MFNVFSPLTGLTPITPWTTNPVASADTSLVTYTNLGRTVNSWLETNAAYTLNATDTYTLMDANTGKPTDNSGLSNGQFLTLALIAGGATVIVTWAIRNILKGIHTKVPEHSERTSTITHKPATPPPTVVITLDRNEPPAAVQDEEIITGTELPQRPTPTKPRRGSSVWFPPKRPVEVPDRNSAEVLLERQPEISAERPMEVPDKRPVEVPNRESDEFDLGWDPPDPLK